MEGEFHTEITEARRKGEVEGRESRARRELSECAQGFNYPFPPCLRELRVKKSELHQ